MDKGTWKKVGYGVLAAGVGAAIFGAVHYYFLGNVPAGNIMGISYGVIFPFILGAIGLVGAYGYTKAESTMRNVLLFGSAAAIGFGIAEYAGWATFGAGTLRARAATAAYAPPRVFTAPTIASTGIKVI